MNQEDFVSRFPRLYHMATSQAKETLDTLGLLSTKAILDLFDMDPAAKTRLRSDRRPEMTELTHPRLGIFYLRDQKPMSDNALDQCLDGMTKREWYELLNDRVFLWASEKRVEGLLAARAYRNKDQLVLTVDTKTFAARYFNRIEVSTLNSGATLYKPLRRGLQTFVKLEDFDGSRGSKPIVEVTVPDAIPDFKDFILDATIRRGAKK